MVNIFLDKKNWLVAIFIYAMSFFASFFFGIIPAALGLINEILGIIGAIIIIVLMIPLYGFIARKVVKFSDK